MKTRFQASFSWYLQCFLHIAGFRSTSLETTKTTKFGSRAGKTHFLQQLDSLQFCPKSSFYCNLQCFLHLLNTHLEPQNLQICAAPPHTPPYSPTGKLPSVWNAFRHPGPWLPVGSPSCKGWEMIIESIFDVFIDQRSSMFINAHNRFGSRSQ